MSWLIIPLCILTAIAVWAVIELIRAPEGYKDEEGGTGFHYGRPPGRGE